MRGRGVLGVCVGAALLVASAAACGTDKKTTGSTTTPTTPTSPASVRAVTVSPAGGITMNQGDHFTLIASVDADAGVTDRTVTWSSSSTGTATVDASGVVTATGSGSVTITATSHADPTVKSTCVVTVRPAGSPPALPAIFIGEMQRSTNSCASQGLDLASYDARMTIGPTGTQFVDENAAVTRLSTGSMTGTSGSWSGSGAFAGHSGQWTYFGARLDGPATFLETITVVDLSCSAVFTGTLTRQ